ncbi:Bro-N domain-containing protein [Patescibacteria group bacterium]|nr:Bro-N domain-containing protein [Patescibacteria group bacterium]
MKKQAKNKAIAIFEGDQIRRVWDEKKGKWYFSVIDVVQVLTSQANYQTARKYWNKMKERLSKEGNESVTNCHRLKLEAEDGKKYLTAVADTETLFRLIQSIPSKKAEPFKLWLAKVGYERVKEIENPELLQERMKKMYEKKGYSKEWIDKRLRGMAIRQNLTDEWKERGVNDGKSFAILTAEISKAAFGLTPSEYKKHKGLKRENLRDHMDELELIFGMLGEKVTTEISKKEKPETFNKNKKVAKRGGSVAGGARKQAEKEIGRSVVSKKNFIGGQEVEELE